MADRRRTPRTLEAVLQSNPCLYASSANLRTYAATGLPSRLRGDDWSAYLKSLLDLITSLPQNTDIVAAALPVPASARPEGVLARSVHTVLAGLTHLSRGDANLLYLDIERANWEVRLEQREFFAIALSPVYPLSHPRHVPQSPALLLQPESSFTRHGISSDNPNRAEISRLSEEEFRRRGRSYHPFVTRQLPKAFRIVKPVLEADPPVRWWEVETLIDVSRINC